MTAAMMLPPLGPMLWRYRQAVGGTGGAHLDRLTALCAPAGARVARAIGAVVLGAGLGLRRRRDRS